MGIGRREVRDMKRWIWLLLICFSILGRMNVYGIETDKTVSITVRYNENNGTIKVNGKLLKNEQSLSVTYGSSIQVEVIPNEGYSGGIGGHSVRMTPIREISTVKCSNISNYNTKPVTFVYDNFVENMIFDYTFFELYNAKVEIRDGGANDDHNKVTIDGRSVCWMDEEVRLRSVQGLEMKFSSRDGYHLKQVLIDGVDRTSEVSENKLVLSDPPQDIKVEYAKPLSVSVSYNEGGTVIVNDKSVASGNSVAVFASTDVKIEIIPSHTYDYVKQIKVNDEDVTKQLKNNILQLPSVSSDKKIEVIFEKKTNKVKVNYSNGGRVLVNNRIITSGELLSFYSFTDVKFKIEPNPNYFIQQIKIGNVDVTSQISDGVLTIPSISEDKEITVTFGIDTSITYAVKAIYNEGGKIKINGQLVTSENSLSVTALSDAKVMIIPDKGYQLASIKLGGVNVTNQVKDNVLMIPAISANKELIVTFEKDNYTITATYSEGGSVRLNDQNVASGKSISIDALTDVKVSIVPNNGYHLKQVKVGATDVTDQVVNNLLTISAILENKEITVTFEKNTPSSYTFQVNVSDNGKVKVGGKTIENGSSVTVPVAGTKLEFLPDNQYRVAKVLLGSKDITKEIVDNVYQVTSVSSDMSLSVTFEKIPTYKLDVTVTGGKGVVKVNDKIITESTSTITDIKEGSPIRFYFGQDKYYEVKSVYLNNENITSKIEDGFYMLEAMSSNLTLKVEYAWKKYALSVKTNMQGWKEMSINSTEYKGESPIMVDASKELFLSIRAKDDYLINKILLDGEVLYENPKGTSVVTSKDIKKASIDRDKELSVHFLFKEERTHSVTVEEPGTLHSLLTEDEMKATTLYVSGKIDQRDFVVLNSMKSLVELILNASTIVQYGNYPENTVPERAFLDNKTLQEVTLPLSAKAIGRQAFMGSIIEKCNPGQGGLNQTTIWTNIEVIGEEAFKDCTFLTNTYFNSSLSSIGKGAFENCTNLTSMYTGKVTEIKESTFRNCKSLSLNIEPVVERIGDYALENVKDISDWSLSMGGESKLSYISKTALKGCKNSRFDFEDCPNLLELPCFENCTELDDIFLPLNIKSIPANAFKGCTSLRVVHVKGTKLEEIGENAFSDCKNLDQLNILSETLPKVSPNSFSDFNYSFTKLHVFSDIFYLYKHHEVWSKFLKIYSGEPTIRNIEAILSIGGLVKAKNEHSEYEETFSPNRGNYLMCYNNERVEFLIEPEIEYSIEVVTLNGKNITNTLDKDNRFIIPELKEDVLLEVKFKKEESSTSIDQPINATRRVYCSAPRRLALSGFEVGVSVYVYDGGGRLVILKTIRDSVEEVEVPAAGFYFIRIGKESFKVVL